MALVATNDEQGQGGDIELFFVFREFSSFGMGNNRNKISTLDSRQLQKLCRDCGLLDERLTKVDIDMVFIQVKGTVGPRLDFIDFLDCIKAFSLRNGRDFEVR
jgi:hypothetical protein